MDINLYQSQKAIEHARLILNEDGILILVSECREGIGDTSFIEVLEGCKPADVHNKIDRKFKLGYHKAARIASFLEYGDIYTITDIPDDTIESLRMKPFHRIEEALHCAFQTKGNSAKIAIIQDGTLTVPVYSEQS
jgi:nickel-dependent lactate racemase